MNPVKSTKKHDIAAVVGYLLLSVVIFLAALGLSCLFGYLLQHSADFEASAETIAQLVSGVIAALAAGLVLYQLRESRLERARQNDIEEASFIFKYNQAFIRDPNMAEVERLLEDQVHYGWKETIITNENRQKFVNYLVYLEGLAPLILRGVLSFDHIDNLMAYRFFLAVNNPEVQEKELKKFPDDYRGCFKLYAEWAKYRSEKQLGILQKETALDKWEKFSKYAE